MGLLPLASCTVIAASWCLLLVFCLRRSVYLRTLHIEDITVSCCQDELVTEEFIGVIVIKLVMTNGRTQFDCNA